MATFNLSGSSVIELTPTIQHSETSRIVFSQMPHVLKRTTALTASDYWRYQDSSIRFRQIGTVTRVPVPIVLRGSSSFTFEPNYHNVQHVITRQWPLSGSNAFSFTHAHVMGRSWRQIKNHGIRFSQTDTHNVVTPIILGAASTITFGGSNTVRHSYKNMSGSSTITFTSTGTTRPARTLTGVSSVTFAQNASLLPTTPGSGSSFFTFSQSNSLSLTKNVRGSSVIAFVNGGYGIV